MKMNGELQTEQAFELSKGEETVEDRNSTMT